MRCATPSWSPAPPPAPSRSRPRRYFVHARARTFRNVTSQNPKLFAYAHARKLTDLCLCVYTCNANTQQMNLILLITCSKYRTQSVFLHSSGLAVMTLSMKSGRDIFLLAITFLPSHHLLWACVDYIQFLFCGTHPLSLGIIYFVCVCVLSSGRIIRTLNYHTGTVVLC